MLFAILFARVAMEMRESHLVNTQPHYKKVDHQFLKTIIDWYTQVSVSAFSEQKLPPLTEVKKAFQKFYNIYEQENTSSSMDLQSIEGHFEDLCTMVQKSNDFPAFSESFSRFCDKAIKMIMRPEDTSTERDGSDGIAGLKNDYAQEMERLNRDGLQFCICLVRPCNTSAETLCELIAHELRGFDRVFRLDDSHIGISLKQTDKNGANRFLKRVQIKLEEKEKHTFNAVIAQPVARESFQTVLKNLQNDMKHFESNAHGDIVILQELSPLERHLKEVGK